MLAVQYYRLKRGWSQKTLADRADTNQPRISNVELGRVKPSDELLHSLARALDVSPAFALLRPVVVQERVGFQDAQQEPRDSPLR